MKDFNTDLFHPATVMDSDYSSGASPSDANFAFAFNVSNFSDRILRIEIMGDSAEARPDPDGCASIADWARHRKRRREDAKKDSVDLTVLPDEQILNGNQLDIDDGLAGEHQDEEAVAMVEESPSGI
ncbi:BTB/POZ domain-containing protein At2g46260-like [Prosopis cineraria]|uniref:BTB/POZ domain-containing protein At2g46260-like n=1 Tax=Prosopis cineraria TaxID=364024 RepID=UPI002410B56A|nr:BTB/POZ domain-containing protein At2g46260-like [Prosopis cineraria]